MKIQKKRKTEGYDLGICYIQSVIIGGKTIIIVQSSLLIKPQLKCIILVFIEHSSWQYSEDLIFWYFFRWSYIDSLLQSSKRISRHKNIDKKNIPFKTPRSEPREHFPPLCRYISIDRTHKHTYIL